MPDLFTLLVTFCAPASAAWRRWLAAVIVPLLVAPALAEPLTVQLHADDDIEFIVQIAKLLNSRLNAAPDRYKLVPANEAAQVVVVVGSRSLQKALAGKRPPVLLAVGVGRPAFISTLEARGMTPETVRDLSAVFVGQSPRLNLALIRTLAPKAATLGVFDNQEIPVKSAFAVAAKELSLAVTSELVSSPEEALAVLDKLLGRSDVLLVTQNPKASNNRNIRQIVHAGLLAGKPVIGGATDGFVTEGALAAVYSSVEDIVGDALRRIELWRSNRTLGASGYARDWTLRVNRATAKTLRLDLLPDAELRAAIQRLAGDE